MPRPKRALAFITGVALTVAAAPGTAWSDAGASSRSSEQIAWQRCGDGLECGSLRVPVDYARPTGEQFTLAVARHPAGDQAHRIGSLVVNFGGPGDPGSETLKLLAGTFPRDIRRRFDIVSFDPRGTGASRGIDCLDDATFERLLNEDPTPDTPADLQRFYDGTNSRIDLVHACVDKFGPWLAAVGSRNVARDIDRLRIALGDQKLNYLGYSYGTVIGAVYARDFPDQLRAMVLDSAVNLSDTIQSSEAGTARGFEQALEAFLADCAAKPACKFHSHGKPRAALLRLRDRFEAGLTVPAGNGRVAGEATFYSALLGALYDRQRGWPLLAAGLHEVVAKKDGSLLQLVSDSQSGRREDGTYDNILEAIGFITCDDRPDPVVPFAEYRATFQRFAHDYPFFGRFVASYPIGCDARIPRPAPDATLGDVRTSNAPPVVVIGTTGDPATPYAGARDLQQRLGGSRLLTFVSTEHGSYSKGIACIDNLVDRYFLHRTLPPRGARCHP